MEIEDTQYLQDGIKDSLGCVRSWHRGYFNDAFIGLYSDGEPNLMATSFAILGAECCGVLDQLSTNSKANLVDKIQKCQDKNSGFFKAFDIKRNELSSHSATYIRMQTTYFAIHALDSLSAKPCYPIPMRSELRNTDYLRGWIDSGDWSNPWLHSNNIMFALTFLQTDPAFLNDPHESDAAKAFDYILDYLDARQDPVSGLWQPDDEREDRNAVFAAYHFFPYYYFRNRTVQYVEQIIDTLLTMIQPDGFFGYGVGKSGACEDLDVIHSLILIASSSEHRKKEVESVLRKTLSSHFAIQSEDGGFPNYLKHKVPLKKIVRNPRLIKARIFPQRCWRYSGWKRLACPYGVSDTWGGWFRPLSIRLIADYLFPNTQLSQPGKYRQLPGLGWHFSSQTLAK
ncbi:hypothetical protein [Rubripirellula obstinata]|uniref:hypothetical protein n=1 Tax=Rubripirellula obstinata TaxID=406547 RepID=UPI00122D31B4|nr:hypothetical protein [Rubripirellula obstinata]